MIEFILPKKIPILQRWTEKNHHQPSFTTPSSRRSENCPSFASAPWSPRLLLVRVLSQENNSAARHSLKNVSNNCHCKSKQKKKKKQGLYTSINHMSYQRFIKPYYNKTIFKWKQYLNETSFLHCKRIMKGVANNTWNITSEAIEHVFKFSPQNKSVDLRKSPLRSQGSES